MTKNITPYQAKYFAYEINKKHKSDSPEKFGAVLMDAKVDLNPHQVEAALFAFKSPFSKGAVLADEVGLGKTIEAGILLSQKWAEGKRRILIISPSSLRKQWMNELYDKFYLPSEIIESKNFDRKIKEGVKNPLDDAQSIKICSYNFARNKSENIQLNNWDLVVIDEAHNLRNVYRNDNKIAKEIQNAIADYKKVLLTATPLQNRLEELYGLISFIDQEIFGNIKSFRNQYISNLAGVDYADLKERISEVVHRNLRQSVKEYINFKGRIAITETFEPSEEEQKLYDHVTEYLQRDEVFALPTAQRHLMTSVLRKLLASSSFAIAGTLRSLIKRLRNEIRENYSEEDFIEEMDEDYENYDEDLEEWDEEPAETSEISYNEKQLLEAEIKDLENYLALATSIEHNAKGDKLMIALEKGFEKLNDLGAKQKAIIFTESVRTQNYLFDMLQKTRFAGKVALFNGSNTDEHSKIIYEKWLSNPKNKSRITGSRTVDIRNAIVDEFAGEDYSLLIATEAAAEGINLQFCSMVVNYDLPWNPQRIEQRIGRCHRYGQEYDVVVINFLNTGNETDMRVFQLLEQKFHLFDTVFGASDEVLGTIGSGVDFEKRLIEIYQKCRTKEELNDAFEKLQNDLDETINQRLVETQKILFENFDAEVVNKLKTTLEQTTAYITKYEQWLWKITRFILDQKAEFNNKELSFDLKETFENTGKGRFTLNKKITDRTHYRVNSDLAQTVIEKARKADTPPGKLFFNYSGCGQRSGELEKLKSHKGFLRVSNIRMKSEVENLDMLVFAAETDEKENLSDSLCQFLMNLCIDTDYNVSDPDKNRQQRIEKKYEKEKQKHLDFLTNEDIKTLRTENTKFEKWANDRIAMTEKELDEVKKNIKELQRAGRDENLSADELLEVQTKLNREEKKKARLRREIFDVEDKVIAERDQMIDEAKKKLKRKTEEEELFTVEWEII